MAYLAKHFNMNIKVLVATAAHLSYADAICFHIAQAAKARGTGIAKRDPSYISQKIREGKSVIALGPNGLAGFCYIECWDHERYVANSGLIVLPEHRKSGLALTIKSTILELSKKKYPNAKIFGITTSLAVLKINSKLGYEPVTFSELPKDQSFWNGCNSCPNVDILKRTKQSHCLCTGMVYTPEATSKSNKKKTN